MSILGVLMQGPTEIEISGTAYQLGVMVPSDYFAVEERIKSHRTPAATIIERAAQLAAVASEGHREKILDRAYEDAEAADARPTEEEVAEWKLTTEGMRFLFWLQIRKAHQEQTEDSAAALFGRMWDEEIDRAFAALLKECPDATREMVVELAEQHAKGLMHEAVYPGEGMPEGNSSTPGTPGAQASQSPGGPGTECSGDDSDGPTSKSGG